MISGHHAPEGAKGVGKGMDESAEPGSIRLRLDISYDGTDFSGWAIQPDRRTVAGTLTDALQVLLRHPVQLVVAGRTDAGVHASGQVAHVDVDPAALRALAPRHTVRSSCPPIVVHDDPPAHSGVHLRDDLPALTANASPDNNLAGRSGLLRRLAGLLPPDLRVREITVAATGFDARFAALRRHYRYRIGTARHGVDPLRRHDTYALRRPLDVAAMGQAGRTLLGTNDFAAYCRPPSRPDATTIRDLQELRVAALEHEPAVVAVDVTADAFCHSMVRSIVGVLIGVGTGRQDAAQPGRLLRDGRRTAELHVAPAHGLTLVAVDYPPDDELAARAVRTRAIRGRD